MVALRPYQIAGVEKFLASRNRQLFAWAMGAGKTLAAITAARAVVPQGRVLVVAPAMTRPHWAREFAKHWEGAEVGTIAHGLKAANLTKAEKAYREWAYSRQIQTVSYHLVKEVAAGPWDMIIVDEAHRLRSPTSRQTKHIANLVGHNPKAGILELTGTAIPNELRQLWSPINILEPGWYGSPQANGKEPWRFLQRFCIEKRSEYGKDYFGFKHESLPLLKSLLVPLVHEVDEAEVAPYLPDLFCEPLFIDDGMPNEMVAAEWVEDLPEEVTHFGIFTHLNASRALLAAELKGVPVVEIDAERHDASKRDALLEHAKSLPRACVVSTTHALQEGISLSFLKAGLVLEFTSDVDKALQFIGRFARQDSVSQMPTHVKYVVRPEDSTKAERMQRRVDDKNLVLKAGRADGLLTSVVRERLYSEADFNRMTEAAFASFNETKEEWTEDDD